MKEPEKNDSWRDALLAQDTPSPARSEAHQRNLLAKIHRRLQTEKVLVGAGYLAVFFVAFYCFIRAGRVPEAANAVWWSVSSMHLLLWFLVFFLWRLERLIVRIPSCANPVKPARGESWAVFICALVVCAYGTTLLVMAATVQEEMKLAQISRYILWAPVFFLFWYPFGIASAVARFWLRFKELELRTL